MRGDLAAVRGLLDRGTDPNARGGHGDTALMVAAFRDDGGQTATQLFEHGGDPDRANDGKGTMMLAASADAETMKVLLTNGADAAARTAGGFTALHAAAVKGNTEGVRMLLDEG